MFRQSLLVADEAFEHFVTVAHLQRPSAVAQAVRTEEDEAYEGDIKGIKKRLDFENMSVLASPKSVSVDRRRPSSRKDELLQSASSKEENIHEEEDSHENEKPEIRPCETLFGVGPAKARHAAEGDEELSVPRPEDEEAEPGVADEEKMPAALSPQFNTIDFPRAGPTGQTLPIGGSEPEALEKEERSASIDGGRIPA